MLNRSVYIPVQGGLADQIKQLYAGILISRKLKISKIFLDLSRLTNYHIGEETALKSIIDLKSFIQISGRGIPHERIRAKILGTLSRFRYALPRVTNSLVYLTNFVFGYFTDLVPFAYDTLPFDKTITRIKLFRFHRKVIISGYFASVDYFHNLSTIDKSILQIKKRELSKLNTWAVIHFRVGDNFTTFKSFGIVGENYYQQTLKSIHDLFGPIQVFGISDDISRAVQLYSNLKITWVSESDTWTSDDVLSVMASAPILVASNSGLALFGGLLSTHPNPMVFCPKFPNNEHWRPHLSALLNQKWSFVEADLWHADD